MSNKQTNYYLKNNVSQKEVYKVKNYMKHAYIDKEVRKKNERIY